MENIYQYKNLSFELKDIDQKEGIVKGYFSAFNIKDSDGDIIVPGAFTKSIKERGPQSSRPRIKWLIDHDTTQVPGVIKELNEDGYGLAYVGKVGTHMLGQDFFKMVESGIITEHSIGFKTIEEKKKDDANYMYTLFLMEGSSLKTWGANQHTPISGYKTEVKQEQVKDRIKRLEKFVKNTDATDETIESLMIEIKQLSQLLINIHDNKMPGMSNEKDADKKYAEEMIPHHRMAIEMSEDVLRDGSDKQIRAMANRILSAQSKEIDWLKDWLVNNKSYTTSPGTTQTAVKASAPEKGLNTKGILTYLELQKQLITH